MELEVNIIALFVSAVVSMILGFVWYSPLVVGTQWMKLKGYSEKSLKKAQSQMGPLYGVSFLLALITAFMLSHVIEMSEVVFKYPPMSTGFTSAFFVWIGFILPVQVTNQIFGEKNWPLLLIDTGYQLVSLVGMGLTLALLS